MAPRSLAAGLALALLVVIAMNLTKVCVEADFSTTTLKSVPRHFQPLVDSDSHVVIDSLPRLDEHAHEIHTVLACSTAQR